MTAAPQQPIDPDKVGRITQIIVGALIQGQIIFAAIVLFTRRDQNGQMGLLTYMGAGFAALLILAALVVPGQITASSIRRLESERPADWRTPLAALYQTKQIIEKAFLEGAGFFNGVAYLIEGQRLTLVVWGMLVALMALTFPSQSKFESWAEQVQRDHS